MGGKLAMYGFRKQSEGQPEPARTALSPGIITPLARKHNSMLKPMMNHQIRPQQVASMLALKWPFIFGNEVRDSPGPDGSPGRQAEILKKIKSQSMTTC
jgi:hypothetical protein